MDKKILVKQLIPVIPRLQKEGMPISRVEVWPAEWNGYYTLAISADWKNWPHRQRLQHITKILREMVPADMRKHILNLYTYDTPESIDEYINLYVTGSDLYHVQSLYPSSAVAV
jgi:hypothetical protein